MSPSSYDDRSSRLLSEVVSLHGIRCSSLSSVSNGLFRMQSAATRPARLYLFQYSFGGCFVWRSVLCTGASTAVVGKIADGTFIPLKLYLRQSSPCTLTLVNKTLPTMRRGEQPSGLEMRTLDTYSAKLCLVDVSRVSHAQTESS